MKCDICKKQEATVFIKQVINGVAKKLHACHACAREHGFDSTLPLPLLKDLLFGEAAPAPRRAAREKTCPACGMKASEFRKTSLLGCPACYDVFAEEAATYLESIPECPGHVGKVPVKERAAAELARLQKSLQEAVDAQNFEEAARLRDRIRLLRGPARREAAGGEQARRENPIGDGVR